MRGVIPRDAGAWGLSDGTTRDIAVISRVNKPVCFIAVSYTHLIAPSPPRQALRVSFFISAALTTIEILLFSAKLVNEIRSVSISIAQSREKYKKSFMAADGR